MVRTPSRRAAWAAVTLLLAGVSMSAPSAQAQSPAGSVSTRDRPPSATLNLYSGVAPGSEGWSRVERTTLNADTGGRFVRNVVTPTLEAYLPDPGTATGAAVVIAPGGGFRFLSYDSEGVWVAQWLAARGIAAFVLKYRVNETSAVDAEAFRRPLPSAPAAPPASAPLAIADGVQAMRVVTGRAGEWGIDPARIGIMGFSAGARVTVGVINGAKPAFAAPIYGGGNGSDLVSAATAPPVFMAVSVDDNATADALLLFQKLRDAGRAPELHVFHAGGHGWGMETRGKSLDHWIEEFHWWLRSQGFLARR